MIVKSVTLCCDRCGQWVSMNGFENLTQARAYAKKQGWLVELNSEICSRCKDKA